MIPKSVLALVAVAVVALVAVPMLFSTTIPDMNAPPPDNADGTPTSVGYAKITADIRYTVGSPCTVFNDVVDGCQIGASLGFGFTTEEHLTQPTGLATVFRLPLASFSTTCNSRVLLTITGPGLSGIVSQETNVQFTPDGTAHHVFGNLYFTATGEHSVSLEAFVSGCYGTTTDRLGEQRVLTVPRTIIFDGEDDG